jgi:hypothetical protein
MEPSVSFVTLCVRNAEVGRRYVAEDGTVSVSGDTG